MKNRASRARVVACVGAALVIGIVAWWSPNAWAADADVEAAVGEGDAGAQKAHDYSTAVRATGLAIAAAITMVGAGMATAKVQAAVGAGGTGAMAEKPEIWTSVVILFAIPETVVVLGFVISLLLVLAI